MTLVQCLGFNSVLNMIMVMMLLNMGTMLYHHYASPLKATVVKTYFSSICCASQCIKIDILTSKLCLFYHLNYWTNLHWPSLHSQCEINLQIIAENCEKYCKLIKILVIIISKYANELHLLWYMIIIINYQNMQMSFRVIVPRN